MFHSSSDLSYIYSGYDPDKPCVFPFIWEEEIYYSCTDIRAHFNQCATEVDDEGKVKWDDKGEYLFPYRGTCGPGCPTTEDGVWVTDDTLTVTHHYETPHDDPDSLQYSDFPDTLLVTSNSSLSEKWPDLMGVYTKTNKTYSGRPVWRNIFSSYQLYYSGN